jgi:hypothetical protein
MFGTDVTGLLNFTENKCSYHMLTLIKRGWLHVLHYFFWMKHELFVIIYRESVKDIKFKLELIEIIWDDNSWIYDIFSWNGNQANNAEK